MQTQRGDRWLRIQRMDNQYTCPILVFDFPSIIWVKGLQNRNSDMKVPLIYLNNPRPQLAIMLDMICTPRFQWSMTPCTSHTITVSISELSVSWLLHHSEPQLIGHSGVQYLNTVQLLLYLHPQLHLLYSRESHFMNSVSYWSYLRGHL